MSSKTGMYSKKKWCVSDVACLLQVFRSVLLFSLIVLSFGLNAQTDFSGQVVHPPSDKIRVILVNQDGKIYRQTMSDLIMGTFSFPDITPGNYIIRIESPFIVQGYAAQNIYIPSEGRNTRFFPEITVSAQVAAVYSLVTIWPDQLPSKVHVIRSIVSDPNRFKSCALYVSSRLNQKVYNAPSHNHTWSSLGSIASRTGAPLSLAQDAAEDIYREQQDLALVAGLLRSLAENIEMIINNNMKHYYSSDIYRFSSRVMNSVQINNISSLLGGSSDYMGFKAGLQIGQLNYIHALVSQGCE
ncbi:MAG: carboxypeptidase-like regulatory domain-containing protein [Pseudomonadota bacterium]|nr:carboxypeptidase-like regulatory domain-containing protein [Pseudomonadota bacterium]